jgi:PmbA protein
MSMPSRHPEELLGLADAVMSHVARGTQAEATVTETASALTRFANGAIHQNVADTTVSIRLRVIRDGRAGVVEVQGADEHVAASIIESAEAVRSASPRGAPVPLLTPDGGPDGETGFSEATSGFSPEQRADAVATVCDAARGAGQLAFGTCETVTTTTVMISSTGLRRHARNTMAELLTVCRGASGSAYAARHGADTGTIDAAAVATEVTERCARNQEAGGFDPGTYEVVLSPYATAEMIEYLGLMGLNGLAVEEQRSFMRFGERLMSDSVTITDDVREPSVAPFPFDGEGASTRPVTIIDGGVCAAVVHDSVTAAHAGVPTTGHSFPQPNTDGPMPKYLCMAPGDTATEALIGGCRRGLLVTRFWYVRPVHPGRTIITGMTRDGTFLIENGAISRPVRDLRFTQSVVDALADVRAVGAERLSVRGYFGGTLAPWLRLGSFTFSS